MEHIKEEIKTFFGQCKCCLNYAYLRNMWEQHIFEGESEIYGKMLVECFSITWKIQDKVEDDKICEPCIKKLRDAINFKNQVVKCQEQMMEDFDDKIFKVKAHTSEDEDLDEDVDDDQKEYEDIQYLEEEILIEYEKQDSQVSQPEQKKRRRSRIFPPKHLTTHRQYMKDEIKMTAELEKPEKAGRKNNGSNKKSKSTRFDNGTLEHSKMMEFIREIKTILAHTNGTPFRRKGNNYYCFFCPQDGPSFEDPRELRAHTHSEHADSMTQIEDAMRPLYNNQTIRFDIKDFTCNCNKKASWHDMLDHLETQHGVSIEETRKRIVPYVLTESNMTCVLCDFNSTFINIDAHMNAHFKNYTCRECGETFLTAIRLLCHAKTHEIGEFPCTECDKIFPRKIYRRKHTDLVHKKRLLYKCMHCNERFSSEKHRYAHVKEDHADKFEKYVCMECGKCFKAKKSLHGHTLRHTGVKNFKCDVCFNLYYSMSAVRMHKKYKHRDNL